MARVKSSSVTVKDVALAAAVSSATVSRVLSGRPVADEAMRSRVVEAARTLGYRPNYAARSLRTTRSAKIILTVPNIANPFFSTILQSAEATAQEAGYGVLLAETAGETRREQEYLDMLLRREADGIAFLGHGLPDSLASFARDHNALAPIVHGCEYDPAVPVAHVHIDDVVAGRDAIGHLCDLGHRHIGVLAGALDSPIGRARLEGAGLEARRRRCKLVVESGQFGIEDGLLAARRLLSKKDRPTALFCFSDELAIGAMAVIRELGLRCPDDVSVLGFDDIHVSRFLAPSLTTISQPLRLLGSRTVQLLLGVLDGTVSVPVNEVLEHKLVVRESTAAPSVC